ncbi:alkylated DNA repair protein alkB homolog 8-like [Branchiostoma floridae]|uniref:tRNA (carboxymethyluridine(34)-5-O)-methyltransferase n=1 Tax=Branchiostoma floridae TaxID=7739 RepID=A0A9J7MVG3_BRAFL|nr:alkylated DNA repair protein alkB homolog 8-like [Branchiostoma floridae]
MAALVDQEICGVKTKLSKSERKAHKKQNKARQTLLRHEGINTSREVTKHLVVANAGLSNGVHREELWRLFEPHGDIQDIVMVTGKPYAFVSYNDDQSAAAAYTAFNGRILKSPEELQQPNVTFYLNYIDEVPSQRATGLDLPPGLRLVEDFVSPACADRLLEGLGWSNEHQHHMDAEQALKHRRVKHFGYEFRYDNNNVDKDTPLPGGLPDWCSQVIDRMMSEGHIKHKPDQITVNQYQPGQGIPPHVDTHSAFEDEISSLSLGGQTVMDFKHPSGKRVSIVLPARSLLVMAGEARYLWTHGIIPRKMDPVPVKGQEDSMTLARREVRTSFTFRKIRHTPCDCKYPSQCDSQLQRPGASLPRSEGEAAQLEQQHVHQVYEDIASHFSSTRHSPWPRVVDFLKTQPIGALVVDVGCGNGKYLGVNKDVYSLGNDRSCGLADICRDRHLEVFVCDALSVPIRTGTVDAAISIAVIHHFCTQERRLKAVKELTRLLKPGGKALIYVWAFEQEYKNVKSNYLKDTKEPQNDDVRDNSSTTTDDIRGAMSPDVVPNYSVQEQQGVGLPVHVNRTSFKSQDMLVPWHFRDSAKKQEKDSRPGVKVSSNSGEEKSENAETNPEKHNRNGTEETRTSNTSNEQDRSKLSDPGSQKKQALEDEKLESSSGACASVCHQEKSQEGPVYHRFYHVFKDGEIEELCNSVPGISVIDRYYDKGNWCVIIQKGL